MRFRDAGTRDIADRVSTKAARAALPTSLVNIARRKLDAVLAVTVLDQLSLPPGNRLEALHGNREGRHSIRINDQYRICFVWNGSEAIEIEIVDYH